MVPRRHQTCSPRLSLRLIPDLLRQIRVELRLVGKALSRAFAGYSRTFLGLGCEVESQPRELFNRVGCPKRLGGGVVELVDDGAWRALADIERKHRTDDLWVSRLGKRGHGRKVRTALRT